MRFASEKRFRKTLRFTDAKKPAANGTRRSLQDVKTGSRGAEAGRSP